MQSHRSKPPLSRWLFLALASAPLALAGCASWGHKKDQLAKGTPEQVYAKGRQDLRSGNYDGAVKQYESLEARYPFSEQAKQGQLDLLYAYYKKHALESAIDQADQFIRENPAHPRVDYAWYIKGLVYFESGASWLERVFKADINKRPPQEARKSFQSFQTLVQQYPKSPYAADSRQRMIYLRNRLADYELSVARYYMKRGAYVGAANRARGIIENYDGAPAVDEALSIQASAYRKLGINDLAKVSDSVRAANPVPAAFDERKGFFAALTTAPSQPGDSQANPGASSPYGQSGPVGRAGRWEGRAGLAFQSSASIDFKGGTKVDVSSGTDFQLGVGYNYTDHLLFGGTFSYDKKDYKANVASDPPGQFAPISGTLDSMALMLDVTYNFLKGPLTPFVIGGLGWSRVDTNISTSPPDVGCWWSPWYGYICTTFPNTKTIDGLAYELGVGLRYDFSDALVLDGSYKVKWLNFDNATSTVDFGAFLLSVGWKF
jgi:outer membrane protein assembly factor BamD